MRSRHSADSMNARVLLAQWNAMTREADTVARRMIARVLLAQWNEMKCEADTARRMIARVLLAQWKSRD
jgi:hypothetical protein